MILAAHVHPLYSLQQSVSEEEDRNRKLGESFRQSRRETLVIIGAWLVFLIWTGLVCGFGSRLDPNQPVTTVLGMPRWVFLGVVLPWIAACGFTFWFSMIFMKDTDLDPDRERTPDADSNPESR
ncbi:MAG: YhdT family protein [Roseibacillus sp.]